MTLREFLGILRRRWYVAVVVFGIAVATTFFLVRDGGIYTTKTLVMFTLPTASTLMPDNGSTDSSVITFAGSVAAQVAPGGLTTRFYSRSDAPLYGVGLREAVSVGLRDEGTQWTTSHGRAIVEVEIVGRTEAWVAQRQEEILDTIEGVARSEQAAAGVGVRDRIAVHIEPLSKVIEYIAPSRMEMVLAFGAMFGAATLIGGWAVLTVDRACARRRSSSAAGHVTGEYVT